jgi:hypothetical protein
LANACTLHKNELLRSVYTCANGDRCHLWRSSGNGCMVAFYKAPLLPPMSNE